MVQLILGQLETMKVKPSSAAPHPHARRRRRPLRYRGCPPVLIDSLRARGYTSSPSPRSWADHRDVMPPLTFRQYLRALPDSIAFSSVALVAKFIFYVFFIGDILMSARLIIVGLFAIIDRLRKPRGIASPGYNPRVAVLIRLQRRDRDRTHHPLRLNSTYKNLHIVVIDDGSLDRTAEIAREAYARRSPPAATGSLQAQRRQSRGPEYGFKR